MPGLLNNLLRNLRLKYCPDMTQAAVAEKVGIRNSHLSKLEKGEVGRPTQQLLDKLVDAYGCGDIWREALTTLRSDEWAAAEEQDTGRPNPLYWPLVDGMRQDAFRVGILSTAASVNRFYIRQSNAVVVNAGVYACSLFVTEAALLAAVTFIRDEYQCWERALGEKNVWVVPAHLSEEVTADAVSIDNVLLAGWGANCLCLTAAEESLTAFKEQINYCRQVSYSSTETLTAFRRCVDIGKRLRQPVPPDAG